MIKSEFGNAKLNLIGVILAAVIAASVALFIHFDSGNQNKKLELENLEIYTLAEKAKPLSRREIQLLFNINQFKRFALSAVNNSNTGMRFPSTSELNAYKNLEKNGYVRFNVDIRSLENFIKKHGFKIDDFSYKDESGYAEYFNYDSSILIPEEIAMEIQGLAVEITPAGKLFAEQLLNAFIEDFLLIKQKELEKSQKN